MSPEGRIPTSPPHCISWLQCAVPITLLVTADCLLDTSISRNLQPDEAALVDVDVSIGYIGMMPRPPGTLGSLIPLHKPWDWMDLCTRVGEWGLTAGGEPARVPAHDAFGPAGLLVAIQFSRHGAVAWAPHTECHLCRLSSRP